MFKYDSKKVAKRINELAKKQGMKGKELQNKASIGPNTITKINKGSDIYSTTLGKLADTLNCSTDYLLGIADVPDRQISLTASEAKLLSAYRAHPEMHSAVDKLLGIENAENIENVKTISEINDYLSESAQDFAAFTAEETEDYSNDNPDIL